MTTGMIGKKDAKREYYQVKEAKRKVWGKLRKAKQSVRHDERSAKCRVSGLEKTKLIEFVRKALRLGVERVNCCFLSYGKYSD